MTISHILGIDCCTFHISLYKILYL